MRVKNTTLGFTLIELAIVVTIVGIMAGLAAPDLMRLIQKGQIQSTSEDIHSMLQYARTEAATKSATIQIQPSTALDWGKGTEVLNTSQIIRKGAGSSNTKLTALGPANLTFRPNGTTTSNVTITLAICIDNDVSTGRVIEIQPSGRIILRPTTTHPTTCDAGA